jgi:hypothetical protein
MNTNLSKTFRYSAAVLLIIEFSLIFATLGILSQAINWPGSLDEPASVNLPLILEQASAVKLGYFIYMIYSVLIVAVAMVISRMVAGNNPNNTLIKIANGFAIGSAVLRVLGIIRWLIPMPILARAYVHPATSEATRESVAVMYDMLNGYAGSVGEVLGVGFFAAMWVGITSFVILRDGTLPRWLGVYGLATAIALTAGLLEIIEVDSGAMLTINVTMFQFWMLIIALIIVFRPQWVRTPDNTAA